MNRYYLTEEQLPALVAAAYDLSRPQGLGFMHYVEGPLDKATIDAIVGQLASFGCRLSMDYVRGRAVKLGVFIAADGQLYIESDRWYDHSLDQLHELASRLNLSSNDPAKAA